MYDTEEEIQRKRRNLLFIIGGIILLIVLVIIFIIIRSNSGKSKSVVVQDPLTCELGVKGDVKPSGDGVYNQAIEIEFKSISPENEKLSKKTIGTTDNPRNTDTFKITKSGTYNLNGYLQDSTGRKATCKGQFKVSISEPSCELEVKKGTLGENEWYKSEVEVGFATMNSGSDSASIAKYYIAEEKVDIDTSETVKADEPNASEESYIVKEDKVTTLIGYVIDSNGIEGTCKITVKKDATAPSCKLKVVSGTLNNQGVYTDNPVVGFNEVTDKTSDVAGKGIGTNKNYNTETFSVTQEGTTKVFGYVKDNAGNEGTCTMEVKRPQTSSGGGQGGGTSSKTSAPSCTLSISGTALGNAYIGNATVNMKTATTNGASVKSYGLAESKATNGKNSITLTAAGNHTVYGTVVDSYGNTGTCQINLTIKSGSILSTRVKMGDYVSYDAGTWTETAGVPTREGTFGGYSNGTPRSKGVNCLASQEGTPKDGWVVLSVSDGKATLVHAGTPECFYHNRNASSSISLINSRANVYLNTTYAESARILNCNDPGVSCNQGSSLKDIHVTNTHYYLPTSKDGGSALWSVSYSGRLTGTTQRAFGIRPVVVLRSNVLITGGTGTKSDPYRIAI